MCFPLLTGLCRDAHEHIQPPQCVHTACVCVHTCPVFIDLSTWTLHTLRNRSGEHGLTHSTNERATAPPPHLAHMTWDRIRQRGPTLGLMASDLPTTDRTRLQVCRLQMLPHRMVDTWPFLPPTGVHVLSDSGDFFSPSGLPPPPSLPSPAAQLIWASMDARGCGQSGRGYPPTFSGQSLSSVFPPHPP